jgi:hypothetical protein
MATAAARVSHSAPAETTTTQPRVRVMRWTYRRDGDVLTCQLSLTNDLTAYGLRITPVRIWDGLATELFDDAISAFQRQSALEQTLVDEGWHLDQFDQGWIESGFQA